MWYKINVEQVVIIILIYCLAWNSLFCILVCLQKVNEFVWFIGNRKIDELLHVVPVTVVHLMVK